MFNPNSVQDWETLKRLSKPTVTKCKGEGQGSCTRCNERGVWNRSWMCFLNRIEGLEGIYCNDCTKEVLKENEQM